MRPLVRFATLRPIRCRLSLRDCGRLFPSGRQSGSWDWQGRGELSEGFVTLAQQFEKCRRRVVDGLERGLDGRRNFLLGNLIAVNHVQTETNFPEAGVSHSETICS